MSDGTLDKAKGNIKEAAGDLTDDKNLKSEGQVDQLVGKIKNAVEDVTDKLKDAVNHKD